jgi:hypothetical protein
MHKKRPIGSFLFSMLFFGGGIKSIELLVRISPKMNSKAKSEAKKNRGDS